MQILIIDLIYKEIKLFIKINFRYLDDLYIKCACNLPGKLFCTMFNVRSYFKGKNVKFDADSASKVFKVISDNKIRYFYSRRQNFNCYSNGINSRALAIGKIYQLEKIDFMDGDLVVDCGANVGDLKLYFELKNIKAEYIGFEPSPQEFECLLKNCGESKVFNLGLWSSESKIDFYISSENADSSLFEIRKYERKIQVKTNRLDKIINRKIKLLKLEAEGAEPEVIKGCEKILNQIEYVSADLGFERGLFQETTLPDVTNFMLANNFKIIGYSQERSILLFKNQNY